MKSLCKKIMAIMLMVMMLLGWQMVSPPIRVYAEESTTQNTITNMSNGDVTLSIEHYENGIQFYMTDTYTLKSGYSIEGYNNKAKNYMVEKAELDGSSVDDVTKIRIHDSGNHTLKVYYQPTTDTAYKQNVHFYDYSMIPNDGSPGINDISNYEAGAQFDHIEGKRDKNKVYGNVFTLGLTTSQGDPLKAPSRYSGYYAADGKPVYINQGNAKATTGIVKSLSDDYSQLVFRDGIYGPKVFNNDSNIHVNGLTNIDDYKLRFERTGDTYTLKEALKPDGSHAGNVNLATGQPTEAYNGGANFYPLDDYSTEIPDSKINLSNTYGKIMPNGTREYHNMLFGMRFDVTFNIAGYTDEYLANTNFNFSGDDDLWVFVDGKLVLDVGGNHGELPGQVNIGKVVGEMDASEYNKDHQLTVLYMERGGNLSNCNISFTLPHSAPVNVREPKPVSGTTMNFDKYLVMNKNAHVPNAAFQFDVSIPTDEELKSAGIPTDTTLSLKQGIGIPTASDTVFSPENQTYDTKQENDQVVITGEEKYAKQISTIDFSKITFNEMGIYRYKITERTTDEKGISIDTSPRYLDVYVALNENGDLYIQKYALYGGTNPKDISKGFTNRYLTSDLTLKKTVTGNQGSRKQYFKFTLAISNLDANAKLSITDKDGNKSYQSTDSVVKDSGTDNNQKRFIASVGSFEDSTSGLVLNANDQGQATFDVYLKHGENIKLNGLSTNAQYTITEATEDYDATANKDLNKISLNYDDQNHLATTNIQTLTDNDEIEFINNRTGVVPTGIFESSQPQSALIGMALSLTLIAIIALGLRKQSKAKNEENGNS